MANEEYEACLAPPCADSNSRRRFHGGFRHVRRLRASHPCSIRMIENERLLRGLRPLDLLISIFVEKTCKHGGGIVMLTCAHAQFMGRGRLARQRRTLTATPKTVRRGLIQAASASRIGKGRAIAERCRGMSLLGIELHGHDPSFPGEHRVLPLEVYSIII